MKKSPFHLVALLMGLGCAALLLWQWQQNRTDLRQRTAGRTLPASQPVAQAPLSPPIESARPPASMANELLTRLERLLSRRQVRRGEALLSFKDEAAYRRFLERAGRTGLTIIGRLDGLRMVRVSSDSFSNLRDELLAHGVDYADASANFLMTLPTTPSKEIRGAIEQVPFGNDTLAFLGIKGDHRDWGQGTLIAVLDTGVSADATFGAGRLRTLDIGLGTHAVTGDEGGHGTAVAALAVGALPDAAGVAPAAHLLSIRVTDAEGTSDIFTVAQAIVSAVDAGAKIVNISLGGYSTNAVLDGAIQYAQERGAVIVAAAGNDQAAQLAWPAADPRVISVGAIDRAEQQVLFSNSGAQLQLTAPGYGVQTAWSDGQRAYVDGTSFSAPLVAGAIAAVMSQNPNLTAQQAAQVLIETANDGGAPGADPAYGTGILNVDWALNRVNPARFDTAVSSHYFNAATNEMQFVVQNRSAQTVAGLSLNVSSPNGSAAYPVPSLAPGSTFVVNFPAANVAGGANTATYTTTLVNPIGFVDVLPANNRRSSTLTSADPAN